MSVVSAKYNIPIPEKDFLSYLFDAPFGDKGWPSPEPLLHSTVDSEPCYTIDEIKDKVRHIGCGLQQLGSQGSRILLYGEANIHFPLALLGIMAGGGACAVLPPSSVYHIILYLRVMDAGFILCGPKDLPRVIDAASQVGIPSEHIFVVDESVLDTGSGNGQVRHWNWLLNAPGGEKYVWPRLGKESKDVEALMLCTSGTTGTPKLAVRTHYSLVANVESVLHRRNHRFTYLNETVLSTFKFYGTMFITSGVLCPLKARHKTIFMPKFELQSMLQAVTKFRATFMMTPKHVIQELLTNEDNSKPDLSSVKFVVSVGASMSRELLQAWRDKYGHPIVCTLGMTELGSLTWIDVDVPLTGNTVGELLPNIQAMTVDKNNRPLERGQQGEIWYKSPSVMKYYCNEPEKTALTVTEDGWLKSGDIGWVDEQGYWYLAGRSKDMFKLNGSDISGSQIEGGIILHPDIKEASVIPVTLPGEEEPAPYGFIVKKQGSKLTVGDFLHWMAQELSSNMKLYGGASFISSLPMSSSVNNKVDQQALKKLAQEEVDRRK